METQETAALKKCIELIEEKLHLDKGSKRTQRELDDFSALLFKETNILISLSTLKRIWQTDNNRTPHPSTLNALAKFLGYENWVDFKAANPAQKQDAKPAPARRINPKSIRYFSLSIISVLAIIFLLVVFPQADAGSNNFLKVKNVVATGVPNTVVFNYNGFENKNAGISLQQSWNIKEKVKVSTTTGTHTAIYYYPGFHNAKLFDGETIIASAKVHIKTDGWIAAARKSLDELIPVYIPVTEIVNNGALSVKPETLLKTGFDISDKNYSVTYYNVREFGNLEGNNFSLETELRNPVSNGGLLCQYATGYIICENGRLGFQLSDPGCVSNVSVKTIDGREHGRNYDFSTLGCNMEEWNKIKFEVKNKKINITLNNNPAHQTSFTKDAGKIMGIYFIFYGTGEINYINFSDTSGTTVYEDNFDSLN